MVDQTKREFYSVEKSAIIKRRCQMLVHSYIYYHLDDNIISDDVWQDWANDLHDLQSLHGVEWGYYDEAFKDWDGSSGFKLPRDDDVHTHAVRLLNHEYITKRNLINHH